MTTTMNLFSTYRRLSPFEWLFITLLSVLVISLLLHPVDVWAANGTEFSDAATKFETWVKGNLGRLAALVAVAVGSIMAAVRKDWTWFLGSIVLSVGVGIVVTIINASFTAVL